MKNNSPKSIKQLIPIVKRNLIESLDKMGRIINGEYERKSGREFLRELREEDEILAKYEDRVFNKEDDKVLTRQELHDEGLKYLVERQKERNNNQ